MERENAMDISIYIYMAGLCRGSSNSSMMPQNGEPNGKDNLQCNGNWADTMVYRGNMVEVHRISTNKWRIKRTRERKIKMTRGEYVGAEMCVCIYIYI